MLLVKQKHQSYFDLPLISNIFASKKTNLSIKLLNSIGKQGGALPKIKNVDGTYQNTATFCVHAHAYIDIHPIRGLSP